MVSEAKFQPVRKWLPTVATEERMLDGQSVYETLKTARLYKTSNGGFEHATRVWGCESTTSHIHAGREQSLNDF
jgi:hypothetical protein